MWMDDVDGCGVHVKWCGVMHMHDEHMHVSHISSTCMSHADMPMPMCQECTFKPKVCKTYTRKSGMCDTSMPEHAAGLYPNSSTMVLFVPCPPCVSADLPLRLCVCDCLHLRKRVHGVGGQESIV